MSAWPEIDAWRSIWMAMAIASGHDPEVVLARHQEGCGYDLEGLMKSACDDDDPCDRWNFLWFIVLGRARLIGGMPPVCSLHLRAEACDR